MIVRLGDASLSFPMVDQSTVPLQFPMVTAAVCDPVATQANGGMCADSSGYLLKSDGTRVAVDTVMAANNPYAGAAPAPATSQTILGLDPKTLAFVIGGLVIFLLVMKRR